MFSLSEVITAMKSLVRASISTAAIAASIPLTATATESAESQAVRQQLQRYEQALNTTDANAVMKLYAEDAVFMPQNGLPVVGHAAVRAAYESLFTALHPNIKFEIDEIQTVSPTWAFARTRSTGSMKLQSNGALVPEANQELFVLHKNEKGQWLFARYIFNETAAPTKKP